MPGYNGVNCSAPCPYPYYGVHCQRTCNCSRNLCDVSTGCIRIVTGEYPKKSAFKRCHYRFGEHSIKTIFSVRGDCDPGYFGKNCRAECSYPYYGEECQGQCDCDEDSCDVSIGCTNVTKGIVSHKYSESCFQLFQAIIIQHKTYNYFNLIDNCFISITIQSAKTHVTLDKFPFMLLCHLK